MQMYCYLLLNYFEHLFSSAVFRTSNRVINVRAVYSTVGPDLCGTLLGFLALTVCDQTGRFSGFGKVTCWDAHARACDEVKLSLKQLGEGDVI